MRCSGGACSRARERFTRHVGRAERQIESERAERQRNQGDDGRARGARQAAADGASTPSAPCRPPPAGGATPRRAPPPLRRRRSGRPRGRARFRRAGRDRPPRRCRAAATRAGAAERPQHGQDRRRRHQREHEPDHSPSYPVQAPRAAADDAAGGEPSHGICGPTASLRAMPGLHHDCGARNEQNHGENGIRNSADGRCGTSSFPRKRRRWVQRHRIENMDRRLPAALRPSRPCARPGRRPRRPSRAARRSSRRTPCRRSERRHRPATGGTGGCASSALRKPSSSGAVPVSR